jgi:hypothetical protein
MRTKEAIKVSSRFLLSMLSSLFIGLLVAGSEYEKPARRINVTAGSAQSKTEGNESLGYHVWRVFSKDRRGFTVVVASVDPKRFNREDMTALASQLKKEFGDKQKLKVGLLDDANIARLFATGRAEYSTYETAERGRYYLDRSTCREYIEFSTRRGKPRTKITIRLDCTGRRRG